MNAWILFGTMALATAAASAQMTLTQASTPTGTTSLFQAVGTFNFGNNKARLEAAGLTTVQGGNPGNGWWGPIDGSGGLVRSWEVAWNNATSTVTFRLYASSDHTGAPAMTMTQTPALTVGNTLVGLDIGARLGQNPSGVTLANVQFDGGTGFVGVPTANASYTFSPSFLNNYHALGGTLRDFTLRGTAQFTAGAATGDSMRFFVNGRQAAVPTMTLTQTPTPVGTSALFQAIGTFNFGNNKARLEAAGQANLQGGNPGNGWWGELAGAGGPVRSWEVLWNNTAGVVTFHVYASSDFSGTPAMTMTQTPTLTPGNTLVGIDVGARLTVDPSGVTLANVQFDGGNGYVNVPTANASYAFSPTFHNNYHALGGTLGSFRIRGTTQFTSGTTTGDGMRFFVTGRQGLPYANHTTYGASCATPAFTLSASPAPISTATGGTNVLYALGNIPLACPAPAPELYFGVLVLSLLPDVPGTDLLAGYGIESPGCRLHVLSIDALVTFLYTGTSPSQTIPFALPPGLPGGLLYYAQGAASICPVAPNNAGILLSNAVRSFVNNY
jgi:hypothetical protein